MTNFLKHYLLLLILQFFLSCNINFENRNHTFANEIENSFKPSQVVIGNDTLPKNSVPDFNHFSPSNTGFIVYDTQQKKVLFSHNRKKLFMPASTAKIITATTAFMVLGDNYRYNTSVYYDGEITDGVINGNIYLRGEGDPSFTASDMVNMISKLKKKGVTTITGNFYYDNLSLTSIPIINPLFDEDEAYNSGISALSCEYNYISVNWTRPDKDGNILFNVTPDLPYLKIERGEKELQKHEKFSCISDKYRTIWHLCKNIDEFGSHRLPVRNTALHTSLLFQKIAAIHGINLPYPQQNNTPKSSKLLVQHKGETVSSIIKTTLEFSVNQSAELLFLTSASKIAGNKLNYSESSETILNYIKSKFTKVDWEGFTITNGSGLSTTSRTSPEQLLAFLIYADSKSYSGRELEYYMLPSGWGWSLKRRFNNPDNEFTLYAKTGTIHYANALAGIFYTKSGKRLLFVFLNSDNYRRKVFDKDTEKRGEKAQKEAKKWHNAYLRAMDATIDNWIRTL